jgi:ABC-type phosphate/phosphonate transport system ATPase subunit
VVSKIYPDGTRAVNSLALEVEDGELVVIVGPERMLECALELAKLREPTTAR